KFGSMRQLAAIFGRAVMVTLPLISAVALRFLMFTLPICFATLPPSRPPSASPTAPVAFADSEPVTFSVPVIGVASDSTSWAPVRRQRWHFGKHRRAVGGARPQPVHGLQADRKRDRDNRNPDQNRLEMHRQTHRSPGPIEPARILQGRRGGRQSGAETVTLSRSDAVPQTGLRGASATSP